jgi:heme-degrading monooxygenase HmoA
MAFMVIHHSVEDYERWKPEFDAHGSSRKKYGSRGGTVLRSDEDPNEITVVFEWDSLDNARAFAASDELREAMQHAGVKGRPSVYYLNEADKTSV